MESAQRDLIPAPAAEAAEFVRFCYRRRRSGWPEIYDEMCAVAGRGLFRGWGPDELAQVGIGLSLFQLPALAALATEVISQEVADSRSSSAKARESAAAVVTGSGVSIGVAVISPSSAPEGVARVDGSSGRADVHQAGSAGEQQDAGRRVLPSIAPAVA